MRAKLQDLAQLAEMKWRFRVVEVGESPQAEALKLLARSQALIQAHARTVMGAEDATAVTEPEGPQRAHDVPAGMVNE